MRSSRLALAVILLSFLALTHFYVPRLTNCLWSDAEFTGWVAPIAHRMVGGERIYSDFTLPIPPASFMVMAVIQKARGRFLLVDELWLCAICNVILMGLAYPIVRRFTTARNAILATALTAPVIVLTPKEIAYDQTALVIAWSTVAVLARALTTEPGRKRLGWFCAAGFLACFTLAFKSSTGTGAVTGCFGAVGVLVVVALHRQRWDGLRAISRDLAALVAGMTGGVVGTTLVVLLSGGALGEFLRVVFLDGPKLKGGHGQLVWNLISYSTFQPPVHISLAVAFLLTWPLLRMIQDRESLLVDASLSSDEEPLRSRRGMAFALGVSSAVVVTVSLAIALLVANAETIPNVLRAISVLANAAGAIGLMLLAVLMLTSLVAAHKATDQRASFAAIAVCAGTISMMHNLSDPQHRPFFDANPVIPLSFASLLVMLDRAGARRVKYVVFAVALCGLFGDKFQRFLDARNFVDDPYFWHGLRISKNGLEVLHAAQRARELAGPGGTVLMLPEDPGTMALIGRPRPKLRGAIIFVDQYPAHVLRGDQEVLNASLPDVLFLHPSDRQWDEVYRLWTTHSAAATLQTEFLDGRRESHYQSDSKYFAWFWNRPAELEVMFRRPARDVGAR